jgi:chromosome segregation ATPase
MPDTRRPPRSSRDTRIDSTPPAALDEAPLGRVHTRPTLVPAEGRVASLQAEVERLRSERASDADETAGMLVHIAESERMRAAALSEAVEAGERAGALQANLESARRRIEELERELAGIRTQWALSKSQLSSAHQTMASALGVLEEMERREEMASSMRSRGLRDALRALGRDGATAPDSSVEIIGVHEMEWELDLAD